MRFKIEDVRRADEALIEQGVVTGEKYDSSFKGAISAFGAAVVFSGLGPAVRFYSRELSNVSEDTRKILNVIKYILECDDLASCKEHDVQRAVTAIKLALKFYVGEKRQLRSGNPQNDTPLIDLSTKSEREVFNTGQSRWKSLESFLENEKVANLGWYFNRRYYKSDIEEIRGIDRDVKVKVRRDRFDFSESVVSMQYIRMNNSIRAFKLDKTNCEDPVFNEFKNDERYVHFELKTTYPGALFGSGLVHGVGDVNEIKIGFQFDYVSGLPYIPGSSVKGILKSMFEENCYIKEKLKEKLGRKDVDDAMLMSIKNKIFGVVSGEGRMAGSVVFFDAVIVPMAAQSIVGDDFITPHKSPLKDPVPIQFLKVLPNVTFRFSFLVKEDIRLGMKNVDVMDLKEVFKSVLLDNGVGAKTNVGYGRLVESE